MIDWSNEPEVWNQLADFRYLCNTLGVTGWQALPHGLVALWAKDETQVAIVPVRELGFLAKVAKNLIGHMSTLQRWATIRKLAARLSETAKKEEPA